LNGKHESSSLNIGLSGTIFATRTYITIVGGRNNVLKLLSIEDINGNKVALCMAVLASLGGGHLNNLSRKFKKDQ
jgi:hypothetical protein